MAIDLKKSAKMQIQRSARRYGARAAGNTAARLAMATPAAGVVATALMAKESYDVGKAIGKKLDKASGHRLRGAATDGIEKAANLAKAATNRQVSMVGKGLKDYKHGRGKR